MGAMVKCINKCKKYLISGILACVCYANTEHETIIAIPVFSIQRKWTKFYSLNYIRTICAAASFNHFGFLFATHPRSALWPSPFSFHTLTQRNTAIAACDIRGFWHSAFQCRFMLFRVHVIRFIQVWLLLLLLSSSSLLLFSCIEIFFYVCTIVYVYATADIIDVIHIILYLV